MRIYLRMVMIMIMMMITNTYKLFYLNLTQHLLEFLIGFNCFHIYTFINIVQ